MYIFFQWRQTIDKNTHNYRYTVTENVHFYYICCRWHILQKLTFFSSLKACEIMPCKSEPRGRGVFVIKSSCSWMRGGFWSGIEMIPESHKNARGETITYWSWTGSWRTLWMLHKFQSDMKVKWVLLYPRVVVCFLQAHTGKGTLREKDTQWERERDRELWSPTSNILLAPLRASYFPRHDSISLAEWKIRLKCVLSWKSKE